MDKFKLISLSVIILIVLNNSKNINTPVYSAMPPTGLIEKQKAKPESLLELKDEFQINNSSGKYILNRPTQILIDKNSNIYVFDRKELDIKVFDKSGQYRNTIGRPGLGPGELDGAAEFFISKNEIGISCSGRRQLIYYSLEGKYLRSHMVPHLILQMRADDEGNIYGIIHNLPKKVEQLVHYNSSNGRLTTISNRRMSEEIFFGASMSYGILSNGQIVFGNQDNGYLISIFDKTEKAKVIIKKDYKKTKVSDEVIKKAFKNRQLPDKNFMAEYYAPFYKIYASEDGIILVERHDRILSNEINHFDIFRNQGEYCGDIIIKRSLEYLWANKKLYMIEEDNEGLPIIKVYSVKWNIANS